MRKSLLAGGVLAALVGVVVASHWLPQAHSNPPSASPQLAQAQATNVPLHQMSEIQIDQLLQDLRGKSLRERLEIISARAKGTPYFLGPLGEGASSPFDAKPLIDLKRVDCMTYTEQTMALALSPNYQAAFKTLQQIRYKEGRIGIEYRNHYVMADWLRNNHRLVQDVTMAVGKAYARPLTRTISHHNLFANLPYKDLKAKEADREVTIRYIPKEHLLKVADQLQSGDIAVLIQDRPGIFESHMGFLIRPAAGGLVFRHATSIGEKQVVDASYTEIVSWLQQSQRHLGLAFIRPLGP